MKVLNFFTICMVLLALLPARALAAESYCRFAIGYYGSAAITFTLKARNFDNPSGCTYNFTPIPAGRWVKVRITNYVVGDNAPVGIWADYGAPGGGVLYWQGSAGSAEDKLFALEGNTLWDGGETFGFRFGPTNIPSDFDLDRLRWSADVVFTYELENTTPTATALATATLTPSASPTQSPESVCDGVSIPSNGTCTVTLSGKDAYRWRCTAPWESGQAYHALWLYVEVNGVQQTGDPCRFDPSSAVRANGGTIKLILYANPNSMGGLPSLDITGRLVVEGYNDIIKTVGAPSDGLTYFNDDIDLLPMQRFYLTLSSPPAAVQTKCSKYTNDPAQFHVSNVQVNGCDDVSFTTRSGATSFMLWRGQPFFDATHEFNLIISASALVATATMTPSPSRTATNTPAVRTATIYTIPSLTPTRTATPSATATGIVTATATGTATASPTATATGTATASPTVRPTYAGDCSGVNPDRDLQCTQVALLETIAAGQPSATIEIVIYPTFGISTPTLVVELATPDYLETAERAFDDREPFISWRRAIEFQEEFRATAEEYQNAPSECMSISANLNLNTGQWNLSPTEMARGFCWVVDATTPIRYWMRLTSVVIVLFLSIRWLQRQLEQMGDV